MNLDACMGSQLVTMHVLRQLQVSAHAPSAKPSSSSCPAGDAHAVQWQQPHSMVVVTRSAALSCCRCAGIANIAVATVHALAVYLSPCIAILFTRCSGPASRSITCVCAAVVQEVYGQLYTQENVAISGIHTHSGPAGYLQYLLYDIPARGFVHETFNVLVNGIVTVSPQSATHLCSRC